jgi:hypothetical protein
MVAGPSRRPFCPCPFAGTTSTRPRFVFPRAARDNFCLSGVGIEDCDSPYPTSRWDNEDRVCEAPDGNVSVPDTSSDAETEAPQDTAVPIDTIPDTIPDMIEDVDSDGRPDHPPRSGKLGRECLRFGVRRWLTAMHRFDSPPQHSWMVRAARTKPISTCGPVRRSGSVAVVSKRRGLRTGRGAAQRICTRLAYVRRSPMERSR